MISEVALAMFTHLPASPRPPHPLLLRPLSISCCSVAKATEKCGNTSVLQRERESEEMEQDRGGKEGGAGEQCLLLLCFQALFYERRKCCDDKHEG